MTVQDLSPVALSAPGFVVPGAAGSAVAGAAVSVAAAAVGGAAVGAARTDPQVVTVKRPGIQTTVQDGAGRVGMWDVGVPPSGAFDGLSFTLANLAVGNHPNAAGLECVVAGPVLVFDRPTVICVTGAVGNATLDGELLTPGLPATAVAGAILNMGKLTGPGMRGYLAIAGGVDVPIVLGSRSTFILGKFGGVDGAALTAGVRLPIGAQHGEARDVRRQLPALTGTWQLRVLLGPHGAPDYLTAEGSDELFAATWTVDHRSDRTGVRLTGPAPQFARADGGEAGMHPSNVHDSAYPVGGIMLSGGTPVIVGPDGPSLGGFVVPCVTIEADRWMLGQFRPGDSVRLIPVDADYARFALVERRRQLAGKLVAATTPVALPSTSLPRPLAIVAGDGHIPNFDIRAAGDRHLLLQAGPAEFDLTVRMFIHLMARELRAARPCGVVEIVEGVRSLLVGFDTATRAVDLAEHLASLAPLIGDPAAVTLNVREVTLPIAFDHPLAHEAMARYSRQVRDDAPWCPDNVEFIRRVNELDERAEVFDIVSRATYLVIGLGDVYLGAPLAVPIDPRDRLVTTKYDPARTWTPQNAVGIGGIYLCVYGMEGPGGYQLVGRTVPVWRLAEPGRDEQPWLLRQFDRIRFEPVSADELAAFRADIRSGRADLQTRPATFSLAEVAELERTHATEIGELRARRHTAFARERDSWKRPN